MRSPLLCITAALTIALTGCASGERAAYSSTIAASARVEGFSNVRTYADKSLSLPNETDWLPSVKKSQLNYLVISGGGAGGAFTVGALEAWTDRGDRPAFDIVSGVSTGALIAPFAFLGPKYDGILVDLYTSGVAEKLADPYPLASGILRESLLKQGPLRSMVERYITRDVMKEIAAEHRKGKRLVVLTSNLDSQRPVIWNLGAIADSERSDALALLQDVLIASASIPGIYPAVLIKAKADGKLIEEMHSDGGSTSQFLSMPEGWMANADRLQLAKDHKLNMYIIVNNALMPEFSTTKNKTFAVIARAYAQLIKAQTRSALIATYGYAQKNGIRFQVASIDAQIAYDARNPFGTNYMRAVYHLAQEKMRSNSLWRDKPVFPDISTAKAPINTVSKRIP